MRAVRVRAATSPNFGCQRKIPTFFMWFRRRVLSRKYVKNDKRRRQKLRNMQKNDVRGGSTNRPARPGAGLTAPSRPTPEIIPQRVAKKAPPDRIQNATPALASFPCKETLPPPDGWLVGVGLGWLVGWVGWVGWAGWLDGWLAGWLAG